jgi:hypothetical protein
MVSEEASSGFNDCLLRMSRERAKRKGACTILTTDANELASDIHDRMRVILDENDFDDWLACEDIPQVRLESERMTERPISKTSNNVKKSGSAMCRAEKVAQEAPHEPPERSHALSPPVPGITILALLTVN